jgi:predicted lipid-binding transport protein (Tim44 family)
VAAGETHETAIDRIRSVELLEARLDGRTAVVTVKVVSDQMNVTRNAAGAVIDGDAARLLEVTDIWTFGRDTRSRDPNWLLVETRTPN